MQKLQQGFTLIELMIVVAIIGILAALAVPAYQDYTIRSKVGESASLASAARTAVDVYFSENGTLPLAAVSHVSLGISQPRSYNAKYVSYVAVGANGATTVGNGQIVIQLQDLAELGQARNDRVLYTPIVNAGNLEWVVSSGSTAPPKYLPRR
ncbi:pilin [Immundisolibacter cernigliae]|uniref:Uncharacterized protein n=1 Tax=Immundisolibacter cernigliae TaxID=1810504 RepID=A0A1B1YWX2_9GAMM|nr:hypothetical protein PG2T_14870 [Immundisolibacter cernigliae]